LKAIPDSGFYLLLIRNDSEFEIKVGARGAEKFCKGYYVYTGSAKKALKARLSRHLRKQKKFHWHIDYLLEKTEVIGVFVREIKAGFSECDLAERVSGAEGAMILNRRFGASDCKCPGHLHYFKKSPVINLESIAEKLTDQNIQELHSFITSLFPAS